MTFGDGSAPVDLGAVSGSTTTQHVYAAGATYTVSVTATASNGGTATASTQVAVAAPGAPSVSVTSSANPVAGSATVFTINAVPAPGGNATIQNVRVTFGDGTAPVDLGAVSGTTSTQHAYTAAGTYTRARDGNREQRRDGDRIHAGGGRSAPIPERLDRGQREPGEWAGVDVHRQRGACARQQHHHPERADNIWRRHGATWEQSARRPPLSTCIPTQARIRCLRLRPTLAVRPPQRTPRS